MNSELPDDPEYLGVWMDEQNDMQITSLRFGIAGYICRQVANAENN